MANIINRKNCNCENTQFPLASPSQRYHQSIETDSKNFKTKQVCSYQEEEYNTPVEN